MKVEPLYHFAVCISVVTCSCCKAKEHFLTKKVQDIAMSFSWGTFYMYCERRKGTDSIWEYCCLPELVKPMSKVYQLIFQEDLLQLIHHPSEDDRLDEVDQIAAKILEIAHKNKNLN